MEDLKKLVVSFIGKTLNKSAEEVSSLLFDKKEADGSEVVKADALNALYELDKVRVQNFDNKIKDQYDKGYKKAAAETLSKFEKEVSDKFNFNDDTKRGLDLIDAILASKSTSSAGELDEEKIKSSKLYLETIASLKKEKQDAIKDWESKYNGRETQLQKEATFKSISDKALSFVKSLNPILPEDTKKSENQLGILVNQINGYDYEIKDDGTVVVSKEGKVLCDAHGHPVTFEDMIKEKAGSLWDFKSGQQRQGTGNSNDKGTGTGTGKKGYNGPIPKNGDEYMQFIKDAPDDAARIEITKVWNENKPK